MQKQSVTNLEVSARIVIAPAGAALDRPRVQGLLVRAGLITVIVIGIFFRLYHIDYKVYWDDEIYTSIHVLGLTEAEIVKTAGQLLDSSDLKALIHPGRETMRPLSATIASLALEDPQHPPMYYALTHLWIEYFGDSIFAIRAIGVAIGLAALPCMYWLGVELFGDAKAAWLAVAVLAISPISVLYSQEAREYSLWVLATLVMCATFLHASSRTAPASRATTLWWALYALATSAALYVYPLSALVAGGNLLSCLRKTFPPRQLFQAATATLVGFLLFSPWAYVARTELVPQIHRSMARVLTAGITPTQVVRQVGSLLRVGFFDVNSSADGNRFLSLIYGLLSLAIISLLIASSIRAHKARDVRTWPFIIVLTLTTLVPMSLCDLLRSNNFTSAPRYFMPMYIGLDLAIVYFISARAWLSRNGRSRGPFATSVLALVFLCCIASDIVSASASTWWTKYDLQAIHVAHVLNAAKRPVVLSDNYIVWPLVLSNYLKPDVEFKLRPRCYLCNTQTTGSFNEAPLAAAARRGGEIYLLGPSPALRQQVSVAVAGGPTRYRCIELDDTCVGALRFW